MGFEAVGHMAGNVSDGNGELINSNSLKGSNNNNSNKSTNHDHTKITNPEYNPVNPLQVITWMAQVAKKYSTISIPGVYGSGYDQFPLGILFNRNIQITMGQCPVKKYNERLASPH